jgi:glutathione S-transferase
MPSVSRDPDWHGEEWTVAATSASIRRNHREARRSMLTLYGNLESGNVYKVRLLLSVLDMPHRRVEVNQVEGDPMSPEFRAINPIGKVPALRFGDGRVLPESGAILYYLAQGTPFWPDDPWDRTEVLKWMFFEQYSHEPRIAVNRYILRFAPDRAGLEDRVAENARKGAHALAVMETHLATHDWLAAGRYTIADIALYAYTHIADEGGFDLGAYPGIGRWLERVAARPGHIGLMEETSVAAPTRLTGAG